MAKTTFGAELRKAREGRGWNTLKLASEYYYGTPRSDNTIRRWEGGKCLPKEENIRRLAEIFELSYPDAMYWYGLGKKLPRLTIPSKRQIIDILDALIPAMQQHNYPAYVLDSRYNRICLINSAAVELFGGIKRVHELANYSVFQLLFLDDLGVTPLLGKGLAEIRKEQILRFKAVNMYWRHEEFYMEYPERLKSKDGLLEAEYKEFESLWNVVQPGSTTNYAMHSEITFGYNSPVRFRLIIDLILSLGNLFSISWYNPVDRKSEDAAKKVLGQFPSGECVKLWEIPSVNLSGIFD
ncbi:MAG: helix-turn-helix transcriptional regulator [Anaerolinea sp.]|nr:helix-turn-helix transcriptional regulator [Anaerolinea sp.]